jgi:hypothetical protein
MLIPIINIFREPDSVPPHVLDRMLTYGEIYAFERSSGWVIVGRDPVRKARGPYYGPERRRSFSFRQKRDLLPAVPQHLKAIT